MPTKRKREYVLTAEAALGRELPKGAVVHHIDQNRKNNDRTNLVILQSYAEHNGLHRKLRTLRAGGNPWTQQICCTCREVKDLCAFPRQTNPTYVMSHRGQCSACANWTSLMAHKRKHGQPERYCTAEERAALGREGAAIRWEGGVSIRP